MTNKAIARVLHETAFLIELTGGNAFRARAFGGAARTIERMEEPVVELLAQGALTDVRGIGAGLAAQIEELVATGSFALRDDLLASLPPGLPEVLRVKGLGAKRVRQLWQELGVTTLDDLEAAAAAGRLATLEGFGKKTQENVLSGVRLVRTYDRRRRFAPTWRQVVPLLEALRQAPGVQRAEPTGALRRALETVEAAELIVAGPTGAVQAVLPAAHLAEAGVVEDVLPNGLPLRIFCTTPERFGTDWWVRTGSEAHVAAFEAAYGRPALHAGEAAVYAAAGLAPVPPELREAMGELEAAAAHTLPRLLTVADLQGSLHNHSTYSDGAHTVEEMAEAARARGLSYLGLCDHSQSLTVAGGLSPERVRAQQAEIAALNARYAAEGARFRLFSGTESDILADGALDYPDSVLASFDLVVASIHTGFNMTEAQATERLLRAIANPYTTILGHPTGRLLLAREGYPIDHEQVIAACAAHGVAIEVNASPYRLDLDWRWIRHATAQGVRIAINPDAHSTEELDNVRWGVAVARKGWLTPEACLNALPLDAFEAWLRHRSA